ncbi:MAG: hypothetical protein M1817_003890 [Caeruleum heppii]|nr:MAG: hypothetical protein M1817_003890 [Caeruleum heppii]
MRNGGAPGGAARAQEMVTMVQTGLVRPSRKLPVKLPLHPRLLVRRMTGSLRAGRVKNGDRLRDGAFLGLATDGIGGSQQVMSGGVLALRISYGRFASKGRGVCRIE